MSVGKLPNDICRCTGIGMKGWSCAIKDKCLRHVDVPPEGARYSVSSFLCNSMYKLHDFNYYIPVTDGVSALQALGVEVGNNDS